MQINLLPSDQQTLTTLASQAGYDSVEQYVSAYVVEFAQHHAVADLPKATDAELEASAAMCDQGMAEADAGQGKDFRVALKEIADKHGLNTKP